MPGAPWAEPHASLKILRKRRFAPVAEAYSGGLSACRSVSCATLQWIAGKTARRAITPGAAK
jgi:hypothetical protein